MKQKQNHGHREQTYGCWGKDGLGVWEQQMKAIIHRMDKQKGPTVYSTGNYILDPVINHNGKNIFKKECIYV